MRLFRKKKTAGRFDLTTEIRPSSRISSDSTIGRYCYIGERCDVTRSSIGNYVSIANNVSIGQGEHDIDRISTSSLFYRDAKAVLTKGSCDIAHDVWIGVDSIIRRGVNIGIGAVVGANSFVNRDVPAFAIVAGSPARIVGFRFNEAQRQLILASEWWDRDLEDAREKFAELEEAIATLEASPLRIDA
ncbi:CatB-related O-acetyltransferase [Neorhizobium turbinariae]|uniref:CatB-related O-acetyltransferase n=1 Tax=Neorhizobium turbinariae TaxID=2937795 RepID=UPI0024A64AEF|nr:CatB-related O-acetyltransferase [Neorhizobium turbinariae]